MKSHIVYISANINNMGCHTVALNMSCPCTEMSAWWWLLVTETCSKIYIIEYIVLFWLNAYLVITTTQWDVFYKKGYIVYSRMQIYNTIVLSWTIKIYLGVEKLTSMTLVSGREHPIFTRQKFSLRLWAPNSNSRGLIFKFSPWNKPSCMRFSSLLPLSAEIVC
jgi:hypothetical protein